MFNNVLLKSEKQDLETQNSIPHRERIDDENFPTFTSSEQVRVEELVEAAFSVCLLRCKIDPEVPVLNKREHIHYLKQHLAHLPKAYECLDSSRPWLCYWIIHSLNLLNEPIPNNIKANVAQFLAKCQSEDGGFGGGPGQIPHLAPTYAAVHALISLGTEEAYKVINRQKLSDFLWSLRRPDGSFYMHENGEVDIRGLYCAISVARLTNIYTHQLFENSWLWTISCQTYEGGFSGYPGLEAHGGYTFCALAALCLLDKGHMCNHSALMKWVVNRQMSFEGGFQGRTNKLVDGCYSFWQGAVIPILYNLLYPINKDSVNNVWDVWTFESRALQDYILICCQAVNGGLIDKPEKQRDIYHTCYNLSGLSISQHLPNGKLDVVGAPRNILKPLYAVFNIEMDKCSEAIDYFKRLSIPNLDCANNHHELLNNSDSLNCCDISNNHDNGDSLNNHNCSS